MDEHLSYSIYVALRLALQRSRRHMLKKTPEAGDEAARILAEAVQDTLKPYAITRATPPLEAHSTPPRGDGG